MTMQSSGPIKMSQLNTEVGYTTTRTISMDAAYLNSLRGTTTKPISMSQFYGKTYPNAPGAGY